MVSDINMLRSHSEKLLLEHIQGVRNNTKKLTSSSIAELVAIFHDLGKINPNFQDKLQKNKAVTGYANHAYLSAYVFFCAFCCLPQNNKALKIFVKKNNFTSNDLIALVVLLAKHHRNLPDFSPECSNSEAFATILSKEEILALYKFLSQNKDLPFYELVNHFIPIDDFSQFITMHKVQQKFYERFIFTKEKGNIALDFYLENQFAFACVLQADKADAGSIGNIIDEQLNSVILFSNNLSHQLDSYLSSLNQDAVLNKLRTKMRNNAVQNIQIGLKKNEHIYELTAPTGSGKTLMMLSLASEIIKEKGAMRIIYALPFLSITEQVEAEVIKIFKGNEIFIQRIDSKSENRQLEELQKKINSESIEQDVLKANILEFQENTFSHPFIITTFVRFFETLLSNRNSELLKLPNFSKSIFLLDEIQALPPRLYSFLTAYISKFCEKFDSYAIISTATQPNFNLPNKKEISAFFSKYKVPNSLLPLTYFENELFNRYTIEYEKEPIEIDILEDCIISENQSLLVILNTINDTKELFNKLKEHCLSEEILLLNTHLTPRHRKLKIYLAKRRLRQNKRIIMVSTQLIEAGVDIDFPVVYRDFATISSIVQSAGRCNRNGKLSSLGKVKLFKLRNKGKIRSDIIYQGKDSELLRFTKESLKNNRYQEKELITIQKTFFTKIQSELNFATHSQNRPKIEFNFLDDIQECQFDKIGKFRLIDKQIFGEEFQYFIPKNQNDIRFENLIKLHDEFIESIKITDDKSAIHLKKKIIESQIKRMSNDIIQVRLDRSKTKPLQGSERHYFNLYKIDLNCYTFSGGINLVDTDSIL